MTAYLFIQGARPDASRCGPWRYIDPDTDALGWAVRAFSAERLSR